MHNEKKQNNKMEEGLNKLEGEMEEKKERKKKEEHEERKMLQKVCYMYVKSLRPSIWNR